MELDVNGIQCINLSVCSVSLKQKSVYSGVICSLIYKEVKLSVKGCCKVRGSSDRRMQIKFMFSAALVPTYKFSLVWSNSTRSTTF